MLSLAHAPTLVRRAFSWLRGFAVLMLRQYQAKACQKSAASLTYMTLFATVPMMTVTYSMFSIIPAFQDLGDDLQALLFNHFLPNSEQELVNYLKDFSVQARKMTVFGLAFLLALVLELLASKEFVQASDCTISSHTLSYSRSYFDLVGAQLSMPEKKSTTAQA